MNIAIDEAAKLDADQSDQLATLIDIRKEFEGMRDECAGLCGIRDTALFGKGVEISIAYFDGDATGQAGILPKIESQFVDHAAEHPPSDVQLERARNRLLSDHHDQLQLLDRRADLLSLYTTYFDAPGRLNEEPALYASMTGDEVRDYARSTLRRDQRVVLTLVPRSAGPGSETKR